MCVFLCMSKHSLCSSEVSDFSFLNAEISTSQTDVRGDLLSVDSSHGGSNLHCSTQKSLSDTDINKFGKVTQLQRVFLRLQKKHSLIHLLHTCHRLNSLLYNPNGLMRPQNKDLKVIQDLHGSRLVH